MQQKHLDIQISSRTGGFEARGGYTCENVISDDLYIILFIYHGLREIVAYDRIYRYTIIKDLSLSRGHRVVADCATMSASTLNFEDVLRYIFAFSPAPWPNSLVPHINSYPTPPFKTDISHIP